MAECQPVIHAVVYIALCTLRWPRSTGRHFKAPSTSTQRRRFAFPKFTDFPSFLRKICEDLQQCSQKYATLRFPLLRSLDHCPLSATGTSSLHSNIYTEQSQLCLCVLILKRLMNPLSFRTRWIITGETLVSAHGKRAAGLWKHLLPPTYSSIWAFLGEKSCT